MNKPNPLPSNVRVRPSVFIRTWLFLVALLSLGAFQVVNAQNTVLTNTWSITASTSSYLNTTNHLTRGMSYNPVTGHVLVASRTPMGTVSNAIYILDSATGNTLGSLPFDSTLITGGNFTINMVGVTTDGVIYVGNLTTDTTNSANGPFRLYRWANETAAPTLAYSGDPSSVGLIGASPRRYGDSIAIRGTGAGTQILLGTLNHTVVLLTTTDGNNFTAQKIETDAEAGDTRWGLVWGAGDTFWAKQSGKNLKRFQLDIAKGKATMTDSILLPATPGSLVGVAGGPMDIDLSRNLLALVDAATHKLRVYDISNPLNPVQTDYTKDMPANNSNGNFVGAVYMKNGLLFALETNNGIRAYTLHDGVLIPMVMGAQPVSAPSSLWEGAYWKLASGAYGTQLAYQWQKNGADVAGLTNSSITFSVSPADAGSYRLVISNPSGSVTSSPATIPAVARGNRTAQMTNLWDVLPMTRQYLTTNHNEYGIAINPVNNNVLVLARGTSNMLAVLDPNTGAEKYYIDYSPLLPLPSGWNKVDVADDGTVYLCNLSANTTSNPFRVDALLSDNQFPGANEVGRALYSGDPGGGQTVPEVTWGITFSVRGTRDNAQILLGSGAWNQSSKTFSILQSDASGLFTAYPITVADADDKFGRLGLDWGPTPNTVWAKSTANLLLIEYNMANGTGTVKKKYPLTGNRSVSANVTGIKYDPTLKLLAGNQNAGLPVPVTVPVFNMANTDLGPLWVDQELYNTYYPEVNFQGTVDIANNYLVAMGGNNGIKAFKIDPAFVPLPVIITQPVGGTWFENTSSPTLKVAADANAPITYQWYRGTEPLAGQTADTITINQITAAQAGDYWVRVSAGGVHVDSQMATLVVVPLAQTAQMTNLWNVLPGTRDYLNTYYYEYGMSFNPATSNLVVVSCMKTNLERPIVIGVMDALTGAHKHTMNTDVVLIDNLINRYVNKVGVADDGVVYVGSRTTTPVTAPFTVYRWENDAPNTLGMIAYQGDPFATNITSVAKNIGWTMEVRGAGVNTEILMSTESSNVVSILTTTDGQTFTAKDILVPGVPNKFGRLGICWGPGNTFWAKAWQGDGGQLRQISYNLDARTAEVLRTYAPTQVASTMTTIAYNDSLKFLAGIARDDQKNLMLYSLSDLDKGPELLDQEVFPSYYPSIEANGAVDFGGNTYVFGMNENNGVIAMAINPAYVPPVAEFKVLSATLSNNQLTITWEARSGSSYQVQQKSDMNGTWQNLGSPVTATGATATFSETVAAGARFYRIEAQ